MAATEDKPPTSLAERRPAETHVSGLPGQTPYTWGPRPRDYVSARGDPRTQPGGAPVSPLPKANTIVQTRNLYSVIAGGSGRGKFPVALSTGVFLPEKRSDRIQGEADGLGRSPPRPAREARGPGPP